MPFVKRLPAHRQVNVWMLAILMSLLALGPFLHAHLGFSKVTGFHVAGYVVTAAPAVASTPVQHLSDSDDESPALGVSASLSRSDTTPACPLGIDLQQVIAVLVVMLLTRLGLGIPLWHSRQRSRLRHRPGLPPPALAPPRLAV